MPIHHVRFVLLALALLAGGLAAQKPLRVYVLAGQSNMEGKAQNILWEHQATAPETSEFFAPFRDKKNANWIERDDVGIKFLNRHGKLTLGYGSPNRTGAEFAFGVRMGDASKEPVLLIKAAWGGRSIYKDFRPPSAGMPSKKQLEDELEKKKRGIENRNKKRKRNDPLPTMDDITKAYGKDYRAMMAEVKGTLDSIGKLFPQWRGRKHELAGFVWFQGWNDQYNGFEQEYEANMRHFIADVRKDLDAPKLPFVIAAMGQNGSKPAKGAMKTIVKAQMAMAKLPGVRSIRTDDLIDKAAEKLYPEWRKRMDEWKKTGSDHPYHYLGSAIWFSRIGFRMADAMLELQK